MMKKLLSTLLFLPALAIGQVESVYFESICVPQKDLEASMMKHGEKPFITALAYRITEGKPMSHPIVVFMNPNTKSWTLVEKTDSNSFCVIGVGTKMEPFFSK